MAKLVSFDGRNIRMPISLLSSELNRRQLKSGGWSYLCTTQTSIEVTCLAALSLIGSYPRTCRSAMACLEKQQMEEGAWPAFLPDREASWTTSLALITFNILDDTSSARDRAVSWAVKDQGKEGSWLWRYKFHFDRAVQFRPDLYGWPWIAGACSWVIPTGLMMVALKQFVYCKPRVDASKRLHLGAQMLLDRACPGGGWNAGNSVVYGVPLVAHVESTAIALLGLQGEPDHPVIRAGMNWLENQTLGEPGIESLAWTVLCLAAYGREFQTIQAKIERQLQICSTLPANTATLALALLALRCEQMIHPFIVPV